MMWITPQVTVSVPEYFRSLGGHWPHTALTEALLVAWGQ